MSSKIYHNPNCGTSRNTLAIMRASGEEPEVIEYMKMPLSREQLVALLAALAVPARELMRAKGDLYDELGLADLTLSNDALIDAMSEHPILMNRPVVVTERGTRLCRPSELVLDLLANPVREYTKEDGEVIRFSD
ncbi:MAG: arsenate reductase (glutaredoxin) [Paraperlucidibaca sp.]|jgi:arsenate reductase|uniref:arsenate reductase (glutaredoxin) n=1 Tax=Paraperlucidibaca sp. TaxID=2708021 RepID=UPI001B74F0DA|nr:arsenate reductase (glutaredoxin) [Paraperlucidibaca sp.]MBQ0723053.1 arsenate reductase (glutaredoxin) [Paraperlucidibaca sp.]MBQ0842711.1 arsenate reductase (glutaredoxin) [Paraperlucidibaca sp.]